MSMYLIWFIPYFIPGRSKKDCKNKHTAWQDKNSAKNLKSPWDIFSPSKPSHTFTESEAPQPLVTSGTHGEQQGTGQVSDCLLWCCCLRVCYMAHSHLGLRILLPQPAECWDYRCKTLYPVQADLSRMASYHTIPPKMEATEEGTTVKSSQFYKHKRT